MPDATHHMHLCEVATVFVPVTDQDRALDFYIGVLGFEKRGDFAYGNGDRWVEVTPSGAANAIALLPPAEGEPAARGAAHCALTSSDIEADHAVLLAAGADVDPEIGRAGTARRGLVSTDMAIPDPTPAQFSFRDPDGNRFLVVGPA